MSSSSLTVYLASTQPNGDAATGVQSAASLSEAKPGDSSLDSLKIVVKSSDLASAWSPMDLAAFASILKPDAKVAVHVLEEDDSLSKNSADLQVIHTAFLLAGLVASGERRESGLRVLSACKKPQGETLAAVLKTNDNNIVKMDLVDDADDLIDEDNLLADASLEPPPAMSAAATKDDCGGRKACDNCTCGRADEEKKQADQPIVKKSSCGKCHLGDAFRCASCPYLGKPAFKPGEEHLVLNLTDDL
jgi:hypothetical protein